MNREWETACVSLVYLSSCKIFISAVLEVLQTIVMVIRADDFLIEYRVNVVLAWCEI